MIDSNFANYSIYCSTDTSIGSYGNGYASNNWTQCAALCDASPSCVAFVYLGGANGIGGGNCYYKSTVGNLVPSTNTGLVAGIPNVAGTKSSSSSSANGVSTTTTISTTTSAPTATALPSGWKYGGCFIDNANGRIMGYQQAGGSSNTVENCVASCVSAGYTVAGMEYSSQCFCDNAVIRGGNLTADSQCNMACSGNSAEMCGAGNRMSVYYTGSNLTVYQVPSAQQSVQNGSWQYMGCLTDTGNPRSLPWQIILPQNNSAQNCLSQCAAFGYMAGGMEYGEECYCGDLPDVAAANATIRPDSECSTVCSGDPLHVCGGGSRMSYYNWVGTPLYTFNYPTGNAAGQYSLLIGGVTIPLVTQQTITGKVTFLEKVGTGPGNDTGAYELDVSQIGNFSAAWRPMHCKTDVFCSASITLPDRAGRQLNIGGWSLSSTYGVRIYWPDGSAGVWGQHDWQENVNELSLQQGRWYPSAMIMANGSVLVVGGETGSNSGPVPTLELLPNAGAPVYLDFLNRTNPNNLYPFLAVLPSGGVFIAYYNEARILDEGSFAVVKTLPNSPAAVNDFTGGRTYPLEGTAVLMPQHAPYTDNLAIMICGGSTIGSGEALDNCVTVRPEDSSPQWVIERMPSKRVISCMTALPDGTYLILNGAKQGVAGFGLAKFPNLNAVLYDPSKPVGSRMSVMANTTVARMYHSEAILLQDGRVMVSGSDPQDGVNPEEYRVEVFTPPYLMGNPVRPSLNVSNIDWSYGQTISFTTSATNVRVSLMGGEASTHGNSMGQRTLFPAFSCSGGTCTVTAPPNAHVCPPGWYQMFVLDGPTPSKSTYIRIGGDPGSVGNWPNYSDFLRPGVGPVSQ